MERKLRQKSFSDVLETAIKQRWGTKRKSPLVNFPKSSKKCKVQPCGYSTSQQYGLGTSIADHESFSLSQPIISEKKLSPCVKQTIRGWKPPLKGYQEIIGRNATSVNLSPALKLLENNSGPKGYTDGNNLLANCSQANSVNCEDKNGSENVALDKYTAHEVNSVLSNRIEGNKYENIDSIESTSLVLKDGAGSVFQDITQTSNIQDYIKSQCLVANTGSVADENTSNCIQSSVFDKEAEMENPTSMDQASNESKECGLATATVNGNNSTVLIESITDSEEMLSKANTEIDFKNDDIFCLSQQSTQPYVSVNTTPEEKAVVEETIEKPSNDNCDVMLLSPKANIFENSYLNNDIHNAAINASHIIRDAVNEDTTKDSILCSAEFNPNESVITVKEVNLSPGKEMQDTLDSTGFKEFLKEEPSKSRMPSPIIIKGEMAQNQQNQLVSEQNGDKCIPEISKLFNPRRNCTSRENIIPEDDCVSGESTVIPKSANSMEEENTNKECEKRVCLEIKSGNTETIRIQSYDEISTHTDEGVNASNGKYNETKMFVFDAKAYTKALEAKFQNVFHFENYLEETSDKKNISMFDNSENTPITNRNNAPNQMKISENHSACMTADKLNEASNAHQKSEDVSFLEEMKTDKNKDEIPVSTAASDGSSELEKTCKSNECALKWTEHAAKESFNREMIKTDSNAVVLSVEATNLQMNRSALKFDVEDQNIKSPNNIKPLDVKENVVLLPTERRYNFIVSNEKESLPEASHTEECQQAQEIINTAFSQRLINNDGKIHPEDKDKNKVIVFKDKSASQNNSNDDIFEMETLNENNSEEKCIKCKRNTKLEKENINIGNKFSSQRIIMNSENLHAVDEERACKEGKTVNIGNTFASQSEISKPETLHGVDEAKVCLEDSKLTKKNLVEDSGSSQTEKYVDEMKANHSKNDRPKDRPEGVIYTTCFNSSTKKVDLTDQTSIPDIEVKNDCEILSNSKTKQYPLKNETEKETGDFILIDNQELAHISFKNHKQPENKCSVLISDTATNDKVATKNNSDFSEMEDDFGLTVSQILRIEDECQQKMFMPETSPIQWAQKVKESRRKIQAVVQEITMLNAMLKKARKEVWQPQSNADSGEGTSAAEDFSTLSRPISHRWNTNLNSKSRQNMQRK